MRRFLFILLVLVVAGGGGLWAGRSYAPCSAPMTMLAKFGVSLPQACPPAADAAAAAPAKPVVHEAPPPAVTVVSAAPRDFVDRLFVSGTLTAREEVMIQAEIDGLAIVEIDAEDGDHVVAGQVLARLDRGQLDAELAQNDAAAARADAAIAQAQAQIDLSQAQVSFAKDDYDRAMKLGGQVIAASTIEQRQTTLKTAEAQLLAAEHALSVAEADRKSRDAERRELLVKIGFTEVRSPVAGVVSRRTARLGATSSGAADPLFRVIENGDIELEADVPEQSMARLKTGMTAAIKVPGLADPVDGTVRLVSEEIDKASRTGKVRIALDPAARLRVGAFASGEVAVAESRGIGAPATALQRETEGAKVLVVNGDVVEARSVMLGIAEGDWVEVTQGIGEGEQIVARAAAFLRSGDRVRALTTTALNP